MTVFFTWLFLITRILQKICHKMSSNMPFERAFSIPFLTKFVRSQILSREISADLGLANFQTKFIALRSCKSCKPSCFNRL